jgi:FtsP/CotA-like multicopper oxidase with cupredoxin domain
LYLKKIYFACLCIISFNVYADIVSYNFDVNYKEINMTGEPAMAMSINDQIPAPTIEAKVGDTLKVTFNNHMDVETSVHWHGILLPNDQDGVPYLTTPPIKAGSSFTYEFPVTHSGTYWYHSHTGLQEQRGIYGSIIFHDEDQTHEYDVEKVIVLSDWTNENPKQVLRNLKRKDDYYALKKDAVQSWDKIIANGWPAIKTRFNNARIRMGSMDISDVGYDAFLINGKKQSWDESIKPGSKVRLRIINAGASSYFYVDYAGGGMTIIEADGVAVMPVKVDRLRLAIAETYDVIIEIPEQEKAYELRATSEDVTGFASLYLGEGEIVSTPSLEIPNPFLVDHSMHTMSMGEDDHKNHHAMHMQHKSDSGVNMLNEYVGLRSPDHTTLDPDNPKREVLLKLTGSMERYVWSFNNKTLSESDKILIKKGENVRFILKNETMMHHPLHLHGHFFRVINGEGAHAPLKHTVNVPPFQTVIIEFYANEEKDWFFHCHNLYHMKNGMARVVRYQDNKPDNDLNDEFYKKIKQSGDPWYSFADTSFQSNMMAGELWSMNTRNTFKVHYDFDYDDEYDIDAFYERHFTRYLGVFLGANLERDSDDISNTVITGINYTLPFLIETNLRYDSDGKFRFQLESDYQLTKRTNFSWNWNTDDEYRFQLKYDFNKKISGVINYDSDFDFGAGMMFHF